MCEVMDRVEQRGIRKGVQKGIRKGVRKGIRKGIQQGVQQGIREGQILLADAVKRLNQGETREQLIAGGMDEETVNMAFSFRSELKM